MSGESWLTQVTEGVLFGGVVGASFGVVYGTYEARRYKVPGRIKISHIGQSMVRSGALFGLCMGVGRIISCVNPF